MTPQQQLAKDFADLTGFSRDQRLTVARFVCHRKIKSFNDLVPVEVETLRAFAEAWCLTRIEEVSESELRLYTAARLDGTTSKAA